jgi:uncharacterized protein YdeI (YjbR/CyaY-like superfamily)
MKSTKTDLPIKLFTSADEWRQWLELYHATANGVWLRFFKQGRGEAINHAEALDEALCYGWIDSQAAKFDDDSYLQKLTPRRAKSIWSKRNIEHVARLTQAGRMTPAGAAEVEAAKADGRWLQAYDSPANMVIPQDFLEELTKNSKAQVFFDTLNKTNRYSIAWRLQTAKTTATRQKRMQVIIEMLTNRMKFH